MVSQGKIKIFGTFITIIALGVGSYAQTAVGGASPDNSAMLDVQSTTKGVLFPRMTTAERDAIVQPATSLMIYNSETGTLQINMGTPASPYWQSIESPRTCRAKVSATTYKNFLCYNLGAYSTSADPFTPSWEIFGGYWQWGIPTRAADGPSSASELNDGPLVGWNNSMRAGLGAWVDGYKTSDDPCPTGYRVPSESQWSAVIDHNTATFVGSFNQEPTNTDAGILFGTELFLPLAGYRDIPDGKTEYRSLIGYYWSSRLDYSMLADAFALIADGVSPSIASLTSDRLYGYSIRCIAE